MQIEALLCGKLVENYVFWPNFSGKLEQKAVEKCVQNTWKQNVQKMNWWKKSQLKTIVNVKKQSFTRVLPNKLNNYLHKWKRWPFPRKKEFCTFSTESTNTTTKYI